MTIEMIDKWDTSLRFNEIKNENKCLYWFLSDFIFCRLAETAVSASLSVTWLSRKWRQSGSQCGCHLRLLIECVCVWSTKSYNHAGLRVAANCNNSQATQNIAMHEFPRNRPSVRRTWTKFVQFKRADFDAAPHHAHLCSEHFAEYDFANLIEYRISKRNLKPTAFPSVQKSTKADCRTPQTKRTINEYAKQTLNNNNNTIKGPSIKH